jgi:hypothetical protein
MRCEGKLDAIIPQTDVDAFSDAGASGHAAEKNGGISLGGYDSGSNCGDCHAEFV